MCKVLLFLFGTLCGLHLKLVCLRPGRFRADRVHIKVCRAFLSQSAKYTDITPLCEVEKCVLFLFCCETVPFMLY